MAKTWRRLPAKTCLRRVDEQAIRHSGSWALGPSGLMGSWAHGLLGSRAQLLGSWAGHCTWAHGVFDFWAQASWALGLMAGLKGSWALGHLIFFKAENFW
jgi:hypothetical protein